KVMGTFSCNCYQHPNEVTYTVVGDRATARVEYASKRLSMMTHEDGEWTDEAFHVPHIDTIYTRQNGAFLDAIEGKGEVFCNLADAIQTLRVNLASIRSVDEGCWQTVA
ncbi:MAG: Gfo/Idh/MocA family oxidoreductase, partial [Verrucomicrobiota bacterium]